MAIFREGFSDGPSLRTQHAGKNPPEQNPETIKPLKKNKRNGIKTIIKTSNQPRKQGKTYFFKKKEINGQVFHGGFGQAKWRVAFRGTKGNSIECRVKSD